MAGTLKEDMDPLQMICDGLEALTPEEQEEALRHLPPVGEDEAVIKVIQDSATMAYFTLSGSYFIKASNLMEATERATEREEKDVLESKAKRYYSLSEICRDIAWFRAKEEVGGEAIWTQDIGIRAGLTLVRVPDSGRADQPEFSVHVIAVSRRREESKHGPS